MVQQLGAGLAEQVAHAHRDATGGQDGMNLALPAGADRDQLGPMAHQLPQVADLGWGEPGSGSRPMRSRSARSVASRKSFFTRR